MQPAELTEAMATLIEDDDLRTTLASEAHAAAALNDVDAYWRRIESAYRAAIGGHVHDAPEVPKKISVVVPTFNRARWLGDALDSLMTQTTDQRFDYEVVVVDNNSSDETAAVVADAARRSPVPLRYCFEPLQGDGAARNNGISAAEHDWIAFFDDDQIADPRWLLGLRTAVHDSGAVLVGGAVGLALDDDARLHFGPVTRRDMLRESSPYTRVQPYEQGDLPGTCNLLVAREVFHSVGLFDTDLNGGSDHDFLRRSARAGVTAWFTPNAVVTHRVSAYRRTNEYFRNESQRNGWSLAQKTLSEQGSLALVFECVARVGQAMLINAPRLQIARLRRDPADATDRRVLLWRAEGFVRRTAAEFIPKAWPQDEFLAEHQFAGQDSQRVFDEA
jgi:GT2 family glycosyltransferase